MNYQQALQVLVKSAKGVCYNMKDIYPELTGILQEAVNVVESTSVPPLPDILLVNIIDALNRYALEVDGRVYGLPNFDENFDNMMDIINQQIERHNQIINDENQR